MCMLIFHLIQYGMSKQFAWSKADYFNFFLYNLNLVKYLSVDILLGDSSQSFLCLLLRNQFVNYMTVLRHPFNVHLHCEN